MQSQKGDSNFLETKAWSAHMAKEEQKANQEVPEVTRPRAKMVTLTRNLQGNRKVKKIKLRKHIFNR